MLREQGDHYLLEPIIKAAEQEIQTRMQKHPLFVVDTVANHYYLVSTAQDEYLLNWLNLSSNRLAILKEHLAEAQENLLDKLGRAYEVVYKFKKHSDNRSKS